MRELGVTSRKVIDRCRAEGMAEQNSITKQNVECERLVRVWFADKSRDAAEPDHGEQC